MNTPSKFQALVQRNVAAWRRAHSRGPHHITPTEQETALRRLRAAVRRGLLVSVAEEWPA